MDDLEDFNEEYQQVGGEDYEEDYGGNDDYYDDSAEFDFLDKASQSFFSRTINGIGLPILCAVASTFIATLPNLEKLPVIGYFRKTIGFVAVVSWLFSCIFVIISLTTKDTYFSLNGFQQMVVIVLIVAAAFLYNLTFNLDKLRTPDNMAKVVLTYNEGMKEYLGTGKFGISRTDSHFSSLGNKIVANIAKVSADDFGGEEFKQNMLTGISALDFDSFVKVHEMMKMVFENFPKQAPTQKNTDDSLTDLDTITNGTAVSEYEVFLSVNSDYAAVIVTSEKEAITSYKDYLQNMKTNFGDTYFEKEYRQEYYRKAKHLFCTNKVVNWVNIEAKLPETVSWSDGTLAADSTLGTDVLTPSSGIYSVRQTLKCLAATSTGEDFKQRKSSRRKEKFTQGNPAEATSKPKDSIQDLIDSGKIV